jgi:hypothetical protein
VLATLIDDRGAAAETDDFFRSRPFLDAEGVTHTMRIKGAGLAIAVPLVVRQIPGTDLRDAISPYGYPGATLGEQQAPAPDAGAVDWSGAELVSAFVRDRVGGDPFLAGATLRSAVQVHDPSRPRRLRSRFGDQIRRNRRLGYGVEVIPGPRASAEERAGFHVAYTETMRRAGAADRYFFETTYFDAVLGFDRSWLLLARAPQGTMAAGAIAAASDGLLHYYLGGTIDAHLGDSPFKNVVDAMVALAVEHGVPLNLGGGVRPGDGLEDFKRGFANAELSFRTHEIVCDPEAYDRLTEGRGESGFFPGYRAPAA